MDTIYTTGLLLALVTGGLGCAGALVAGWMVAVGRSRPRWLRRGCLTAGAIALVAGALSAAVHASFGHGPASPEPMPVASFVVHHKAYWVASVLATGSLVGGWLLARRGRGRKADG